MDTNTLRELSRAATPAPWRALLYKTGHDFEPPTIIEPNINCGNGYDGEIKADDCRLIVALRNDAEKYADLVDAVKAYRKATDMRETLAAENNRSEYAVACVNETNAYRAMLAALAALGGED